MTGEDRLLIVAPHPDDETLGTGGAIQEALVHGASVKVVYLTDGDLIWDGRMRRKEAVRAMEVLGLDPGKLFFLGYPDFWLFRLWKKIPEGAGKCLLSDLKNILTEFRPTRILVTAPFDRNRDHQAAFLFLNAALDGLRPRWAPSQVLLYLIHACRRPHHLNWITHPLNPQQIEKKRHAILQYVSQLAFRRDFLLSFVRTHERFLEWPCHVDSSPAFCYNNPNERGIKAQPLKEDPVRSLCDRLAG